MPLLRYDLGPDSLATVVHLSRHEAMIFRHVKSTANESPTERL